MTTLSRKTVAILLMAFATIAVAFTSMYITLSLTAKQSENAGSVYIIDDQEHETISRYARLEEVYQRIMSEYYREPDPDQLIQGAIDGMMASLKDPYTVYYTPEELSKINEDHNGLYTGIGMLVTSDEKGRLLVLRVFSDSPARQAGILPGDIILTADGSPLSAETAEIMNEAVSKIKGEIGSSVELEILRDGEKIRLSVERRSVSVNRVEYQILDGNIGYLVLYEFFGDAVSGVREALEAFQDANVDAVIFDVRSNTGGQLDICLEICDMVLPEGIIVYTEDRYGYREYYYSQAKHYDFPMAILVNELTASASEIFASAAQDYEIAAIVGTQTYGKGIVQTQYPFLSDNAAMKLTTSSYYSPLGRSIHGEGVTPDVAVELDESYDASIYAPDLENDNQLKAAYDLLMSQIHAE